MKQTLRKILLCLCAMVLFATSTGLAARDRSPGRPVFEDAYAAEQERPDDAIELYRRALEMGLGRDLALAARWRLFYLYRKQQRYGEALDMAGKLGSDRKLKNVLDDLYTEIGGRFKIAPEAARDYAAGLKLLVRKEREAALLEFEKVLRKHPENEKLRRDITSRLIRGGGSGQALTLLEKIGARSDGSAQLAQADLMVKLKRDAEAETLLETLARSPDAKLEAAERSHVCYLKGRLSRRTRSHSDAVAWFRLAAVEAMQADESELQARMQGLAAYGLYRGGQNVQALALMRGLPASDDADVELLRLVLRADVAGDEDALRRLRAQKNELQKRRQTTLVREALRILRGESSAPVREKQTTKETGHQPEKQNESDEKRRDAFWQQALRSALGPALTIVVPADYRVVLYRNQAPMQFHGYSRTRGEYVPQLDKALVLPTNVQDLGDLLRSLKGDFVVALVDSKTLNDENARRKALSGIQLQLVNVQSRNPDIAERPLLLLNLHANAAGELIVEFEEDAGLSRMPAYGRGRVEHIQLQYEDARSGSEDAESSDPEA